MTPCNANFFPCKSKVLVTPLIVVPLQELLTSIGSLEFNGGCAEISEVSNCSGDVSFHSFIHEMKLSLDRLRDLEKHLGLYSAL